jgi:hypothetical protein
LRIEDLQQAENCVEVLEELTTVRYPMDSIVRAIRNRVNVGPEPAISVKEILNRFSPAQRTWYRTILQDLAPELGYDPEDDRPLASPSLISDGTKRTDETAGSLHEKVFTRA